MAPVTVPVVNAFHSCEACGTPLPETKLVSLLVGSLTLQQGQANTV